jgi:hypothetical protein
MFSLNMVYLFHILGLLIEKIKWRRYWSHLLIIYFSLVSDLANLFIYFEYKIIVLFMCTIFRSLFFTSMMNILIASFTLQALTNQSINSVNKRSLISHIFITFKYQCSYKLPQWLQKVGRVNQCGPNWCWGTSTSASTLISSSAHRHLDGTFWWHLLWTTHEQPWHW